MSLEEKEFIPLAKKQLACDDEEGILFVVSAVFTLESFYDINPLHIQHRNCSVKLTSPEMEVYHWQSRTAHQR